MPSVTLRVTDSMRVSGWIEQEKDKVSASAKARLVEILSEKDIPVPRPRGDQPGMNTNFWLSTADHGRLMAMSQRLPDTPSVGDLISQLLVAAFEAWVRGQSEKKCAEMTSAGTSAGAAAGATADPVSALLQAALAKVNRSMRKEQASLTKVFAAFTGQNTGQKAVAHQVLFAEAGTGVGKTAAYLAGAAEFLQSNAGSRVFVAVPTFALANQVLREWEVIRAALSAACDTMALIGQGEFVSELAIQSLLNEEIETDFGPVSDAQFGAIRAWMDAGAPCAPDALIRHAWTMTGLMHACPEFAHGKLVSLDNRTDDEDVGFKAYQAQWAKMGSAHLVVCTHAMVASLVRRRLYAQSRFMRDDEQYQAEVSKWREAASKARKDAKGEVGVEEATSKKAPKKTKAAKQAELALMVEQSDQIGEAVATLNSGPAKEREKRLYEITNAIYGDRAGDIGLDVLPNIDMLIVDEGHLLEDAFAAVFSQDISLLVLQRDAERLSAEYPGAMGAGGLAQLKEVIQVCKTVREASVDQVLALDLGRDSVMEKLTVALESFLTPKKQSSVTKVTAIKSSSTYRRLAGIARGMRLVIESGSTLSNGNASMAAVMHWSPSRGFPRINVGRLNCSRELHYLWQVVSGRAIVVSGTLYELFPAPSCETMRRSLAVPVESLVTMNPIHAAWQITPVTLCKIGLMHAADGRVKFLRPRREEKAAAAKSSVEPGAVETGVVVGGSYAAAQRAWAKDVCGYIADAHTSAAGGALVLGTAYADILMVAEMLRGVPDMAKVPVLAQAPGVSLAGLRVKFLELVRQGQRPVLLAVGSAWTGFDIYDEAHPDALTDLFILNAPFGVIRRTVSRMLRMSRKTGNFETSLQVLILVRQAFGRLVRSPETPHNRRIHWLDPRINQTNMIGMLASVVRFLGNYKSITVS